MMTKVFVAFKPPDGFHTDEVLFRGDFPVPDRGEVVYLKDEDGKDVVFRVSERKFYFNNDDSSYGDCLTIFISLSEAWMGVEEVDA